MLSIQNWVVLKYKTGIVRTLRSTSFRSANKFIRGPASRARLAQNDDAKKIKTKSEKRKTKSKKRNQKTKN